MHTADTAPIATTTSAPQGDPATDAGPRTSWAVLALALTA
jgi:hypothetical protein